MACAGPSTSTATPRALRSADSSRTRAIRWTTTPRHGALPPPRTRGARRPARPTVLRVTTDYTLHVNGTERAVVGADPGEPLLVVLRERLGSSVAQGRVWHRSMRARAPCSSTGSPTVRASCWVRPQWAARSRRSKASTTIPSRRRAPRSVEAGAVQCGFCTPGLVVQVVTLLVGTPDPGDAAIPGSTRRQPVSLHGLRADLRSGAERRDRADGRRPMSSDRGPQGGVGHAVLRPDGPAKAAGTFVFANDLRTPGQVHGAILRSPHPHARVRSIDATGAAALPGVHAVVTAADLASDATWGLVVPDHPVFATDVVRYAGQPVAAVAADDPATARRALARIAVEYEVLEPRFGPDLATLHSAPPCIAPTRTCTGTKWCFPANPTPPAKWWSRAATRARGPGPGLPRARSPRSALPDADGGGLEVHARPRSRSTTIVARSPRRSGSRPNRAPHARRRRRSVRWSRGPERPGPHGAPRVANGPSRADQCTAR